MTFVLFLPSQLARSLMVIFVLGSLLFADVSEGQAWVPEDKLQRLCETWNEGLGSGSSPNFFGMVLGDLIQPDLADFARLGWIVINPMNSAVQKAWKDLASHYWKTPRFYRVIHLVSESSQRAIFEKCFSRLSGDRLSSASAAFMGTLQAYAYSVSGVATVAMVAGAIYLVAKLGVVRAAFLQVTLLRWLVSRVSTYMLSLLTAAIVKATTDPQAAPFVFRALKHLHEIAGWKRFVALMTPIFAFVPSALAGQRHEWMEQGGRDLLQIAEGTKDIIFAIDDAMTPADLDAEFEFYLRDKVARRQALSWREANVVLSSRKSVGDGTGFSDLDREFAMRQKTEAVERKIQARKCLEPEEHAFALEHMGFRTDKALGERYLEVARSQSEVASFLRRIDAVDPTTVMMKVRSRSASLSAAERRYLIRTVPYSHFSPSDLSAIQDALGQPGANPELGLIRKRIAQRHPVLAEEIRVIGQRIPKNSWSGNERQLVENLIWSHLKKERVP